MAAPIWSLVLFAVLALSFVARRSSADSYETKFGLCSRSFKDDDDDDDDDDDEDYSPYNTNAGPVAGKLNVHFVAHTHDDVGWLKTVDQYFVGSNNSIQVAAVQYIIGSVIDSLLKNPNRRFIYVEQAFFQRWWRVQTKQMQKKVKKLVESGQLEFINGGWCMHDEATTHYVDMIDQTTLGHRYIKKQFDVVPRIGWQIDPFGHSAVQGYLLGAEVGFDAVFFGRADYQDKLQRQKTRTMEFIWRGSKSLGSSAQIFGGLLGHHYSAPEEFRFDIKSTSPVIQDDPLLYDYNVEERVELFVKLAREQAAQFRTNHIMWTMGEDFAYEYAETWFKQMDKLVHYVNKDGRVNILYSTPSIYLDAKHAANETWPLKEDDFFPYADCPHCYWTGYFTSRSALKRYVRKLSGVLQAARQLEFVVGKNETGPNTDSLEDAMAIVQHHDGVSGTERQHVANDYSKRLSIGAAEAAEVINTALTRLVSGNAPSSADSLKFESCFHLNVSYCPPSEVDLSAGKTLVVVAYNPLGWSRHEMIRIPVTSSSLTVTDSDGQAIPSQLVPLSNSAKTLREKYVRSHGGVHFGAGSLRYLVFQASVPPLGYRTFHIRASAPGSIQAAQNSFVQKIDAKTGDVHLQSKGALVQISLETGRIQKMKNMKTGVTADVEQSYCWYNASDGNTVEDHGQASGAYVFRPNSSTCFPVESPNGTVQLTVVRGPLVEEVHQTFSHWLSQVVRLYKEADHAELEFTIGPIPIGDGLGKEVVTKLSSNLSSDGEFYTDSNGRDFLKRVRNYRSDWTLKVTEEVAGNYYPLNLGIYLSDKETDLSVLVDRALGGGSIKDGELEVMLHRRLLYDDLRGVSDILNETVCTGEPEVCEGLTVQGAYYLHASSKTEAPKWRRSYGQEILSPLQLAFTVLESGDANVGPALDFSLVASDYSLPPNVALITLQELEEDEILFRLAHLYQVGEDNVLSAVASVDTQALFGTRRIDKIEEVTLTANQKKSDVEPLQWTVEKEPNSPNPMRGRKHEKNEVLVELAPMEIRTFVATFKD
ncbi:hypothetical protein R1flu_014221 [Riccia fluitans]|uniref:Alpha-mannosidase n=1 Tax=Riccia fluitans TaxID=41844 RepID=A0ABD1YFU3_9MARC